jgi:hypothetical protein
MEMCMYGVFHNHSAYIEYTASNITFIVAL